MRPSMIGSLLLLIVSNSAFAEAPISPARNITILMKLNEFNEVAEQFGRKAADYQNDYQACPRQARLEELRAMNLAVQKLQQMTDANTRVTLNSLTVPYSGGAIVDTCGGSAQAMAGFYERQEQNLSRSQNSYDEIRRSSSMNLLARGPRMQQGVTSLLIMPNSCVPHLINRQIVELHHLRQQLVERFTEIYGAVVSERQLFATLRNEQLLQQASCSSRRLARAN